MEEPKRRYHIKLTGCADSMSALSLLFQALGNEVQGGADLDEYGKRRIILTDNGVFELSIESNPDATRESYYKELDAWVDAHEMHPANME